MEILRLAVESRKVQLVDIALDLIQKLMAHKHIQGPVFSISHRREAGGKGGGRRRITDDDEDLESVGADSSLPQVPPPKLIHLGFRCVWECYLHSLPAILSDAPRGLFGTRRASFFSFIFTKQAPL
jgi:hypothetical protein